jgi:hypothetical protein
MTVDVRLTFANENEALAVAAALALQARKWPLTAKSGVLLDATAEAIRMRVDEQRTNDARLGPRPMSAGGAR